MRIPTELPGSCPFSHDHSVVWHQNNRFIVSEPTRFIIHNVLNLPRNRLMTRYLSLCLTFLISGALHLVIDIASGISWQKSGAIRFFCTQVFGILIEEAWLTLYRWSPSLQKMCRSRVPWVKMIGRAWVAAFLVWTVPSYMYPMMRITRNGSKDSILPYSVLANLF